MGETRSDTDRLSDSSNFLLPHHDHPRLFRCNGGPPLSSPEDCTARWATGMATRRSVLGDAYVDAAQARTTPFDESFQTFITEGAWGSVWSRPGLSKRERSMITIALLAALGHDEEVAMHVRATRNTGASREDIAEALLHVAIYAGVPAANRAYKIAKAVFAEDGTGATHNGGNHE